MGMKKKHLLIGGHDMLGTTIASFAQESEKERGVTIVDSGTRRTEDPFSSEKVYSITSHGSYDYPYFDDAPKTKSRKQSNRKVKPRKKARNGPSGKKRKKK